MPDPHRQRLDLLDRAVAAAVEHRFDEAARLAHQVLTRTPGCLVALRVLAWAQLELGEERALDTFQRCAELDPEDALAEVGQAIWHQQRNRDADAVAHWTRAWELDPHNQPIRRALVRLTGELPDSELAEGISLLRVGRWDEAAEVLRHVHGIDPSKVAASLGLLTAWRVLRAYGQANRLALEVHSLAPTCVKGLLYVAAIEESQGRTLRGRELLSRAEQADPGLVLFGDLARELFPLPETTRASRPALASAR
jgi:tetratricopeptide (TPR) repeat protein